MLTLLVVAPTSVRAEPVTWAFLVGIDQYDHAPQLQFCSEDVSLVAGALESQRGLEPGRHVVALTDGAEPQDRLRPTRANIDARLAEFLARPLSEDTVVVFFSGHGFVDDAGQSYLAPIDCNPADLDKTALPLAELREALRGCQAERKLLIVDACHSGGVKGLPHDAQRASDDDSRARAPARGLKAIGPGPRPVTAKELERELGGRGGVYTLASCQADQTSLQWTDKEQGLFTYWLGRGLEGAADANGDTVIGGGELYKFVHEQVERTARRLGHDQTPVEIKGPDVPGELEVVRLREESAGDSLERVAELVHEMALSTSVKMIGVAEFTNELGAVEELGGPLGTFGRVAAAKVEQALTRLATNGGSPYGVRDVRQVTEAMRTRNFQVVDLARPARLAELAEPADDGLALDALVTGSFARLAEPERLRLTCKVLRLPQGDLLGHVTGVVRIDRELWALLGGSADLRNPPAPGPEDEESDFVAWLDAEAAQAEQHPMLEPDFPYSVRILAPLDPRRPRTPREKPLVEVPFRAVAGGPVLRRDLVFRARQGEKFVIQVENHTPRQVLMRLLVDGVNTRPQPDEVDVRHVTLDEAAGWVLQPDSTSAIAGWYYDLGQAGRPGRFHEFVFVEPARAVAARQGFGQDVGQITAAFYEEAPPGQRGGLGVGKGRERRQQVPGAIKFHPQDDPVAVINLRYVER